MLQKASPFKCFETKTITSNEKGTPTPSTRLSTGPLPITKKHR